MAQKKNPHTTRPPLAKELTRQDKQLSTVRSVELIQGVAGVVKYGFKYGSRVAIAWFAYLSIDSLAGKTTNADLFLKVLTNLASSDSGPEITSYVVAIFALYMANRWKRQHRDTIEELGRVRTAYEKLLDPKRTTSELTTRGETRKEDDR